MPPAPARGATVTTHFSPDSNCTLEEEGIGVGMGEVRGWRGEEESTSPLATNVDSEMTNFDSESRNIRGGGGGLKTQVLTYFAVRGYFFQ
jgi:hypothetical protein